MHRRFKWLGKVIVLIAVAANSSLASAGGICRQTATHAQVTQTTGLAIVPFAVPVAVPVAVVPSPAVLYSVRQQAGVEVSPAPSEMPTHVSLDPALVLRRHCAACHQGEAAVGKLPLFDRDGRLFEKLPRHLVIDAVTPDETGRPAMPPTGQPPLTAEEIRALRRWGTAVRDAAY